jgi:hypothetical protein
MIVIRNRKVMIGSGFVYVRVVKHREKATKYWQKNQIGLGYNKVERILLNVNTKICVPFNTRYITAGYYCYSKMIAVSSSRTTLKIRLLSDVKLLCISFIHNVRRYCPFITLFSFFTFLLLYTFNTNSPNNELAQANQGLV